MTRKFLAKAAMLCGAAAAALLLTVCHPSPQGLVPFGVGQAQVRAAPGTPASKAKTYDLTALKLFNQTLVKVRDNYVDPTRIDAKGMLVAALDSVQRNIAEVMIAARDDKTAITVHVNDKTHTFQTGDVDSVWKLASRLKEIFRFIQANMNPGSDPAQIEYAAVNGMLSTLDPHSSLLDPEAAREMDAQFSGKFGGIGIVIGLRKDKASGTQKLTVINLINGDTPAARGGLKAGDHIIQINDEPTAHLTLNEAMNRLRGDPQTKVKVFIERKGAPTRPVMLTRDIIRVSSVHSRMLAGHVGYLKVDQFTSDVANDMKRQMDALRRKGARAWVLDLRNNPGGLLDQAVRMADVFLESGTIVATVGYGGKQREEKRAQSSGTDSKAPIAVLVNAGSASASEIVAGAVKNLDRGVIIGENSFGKGSVQVLFDYDDGSKLRLTILQYLTPGDVSIQSVGITPDIQLDRAVVPPKIAGFRDVVRLLRPIVRYREADLDAHLTSKNAKTGDKPVEVVRFLDDRKKPAPTLVDDDNDADTPPVEDEDEIEDPVPVESDKFKEDFEIRFARELLSATPEPRRRDLLRAARPFLQKRRAEEENKIASALAKLGVNWSVGPKVAGAKLVAQVTTDKPGNKVVAGDVVAITGTVTNQGTAPAYQVHARGRCDDWVFEGIELPFGRIDPGASRQFKTFVKVPRAAEMRVDEVRWEWSAAHGVGVQAAPLKVAIDGLPRPQFAYTYQLVDEKGNGDGLLQLGERVRLRVNFKNVGDGAGLATTAMLRSASGDRITVNKGRYELKKVNPNETKSVEFTFDVKKDFSEKEAVLELTVYDIELREGANEKLKFPIRPSGAGPAPAKGVVRVAKRNVEVREGGAGDAPVLGTARKGALLALTGRDGNWVRVELERGRPGFLPASAVTPASGTPTANAFTPVWQVTPPTLALAVPKLETTGDRWTLQGTATDDHKIEDVFVLVSNRNSKIEAKKVFYASNRGRKTRNRLAFKTEIPLWPGNNMITVVARENNDVKAIQNVFILRNGARGKGSVVGARAKP